jgi:hypothetical protein
MCPMNPKKWIEGIRGLVNLVVSALFGTLHHSSALFSQMFDVQNNRLPGSTLW